MIDGRKKMFTEMRYIDQMLPNSLQRLKPLTDVEKVILGFENEKL